MEKTRRRRLRRTAWRPWLSWVLFAAVLSYALICGYFWTVQDSKIYEPSPLIQTTPDRLGLRYEALRIPLPAPEQGELAAWWIPAERMQAPVMLYLHGNYRNISHNLEHVQRLHEMGFHLLLVDYRGYGASSAGPPHEQKLYADAEAAWGYLLERRAVRPERAYIYGHSLGGAVAIELALHHPEAAGLIVESSFTSMQAMGELNYPWLPVGLLLNQRFDSLAKVGQLKLPVLFIHGTWDSRVPYTMSQALYDAAPMPKQLLLVEGGEHSNCSSVGRVEYQGALRAFTGLPL